MNTKQMLSWNDITYRQLLEIRNMDKENPFPTIELARIVFGDEVLDLNIQDFSAKTKQLEFLKTQIPNDLHVKQVKVNGREYYFDGLLGNITTAQYIDFQNYLLKNDEVKCMSVFMIPKGHKYNDGYDMEQVFSDVLDMPATVVTSSCFFFSRQLELFTRIFQRYLIRKLKKQKLPKELVKAMEQVVESITNLESYHLS